MNSTERHMLFVLCDISINKSTSKNLFELIFPVSIPILVMGIMGFS